MREKQRIRRKKYQILWRLNGSWFIEKNHSNRTRKSAHWKVKRVIDEWEARIYWLNDNWEENLLNEKSREKKDLSKSKFFGVKLNFLAQIWNFCPWCYQGYCRCYTMKELKVKNAIDWEKLNKSVNFD